MRIELALVHNPAAMCWSGEEAAERGEDDAGVAGGFHVESPRVPTVTGLGRSFSSSHCEAPQRKYGHRVGIAVLVIQERPHDPYLMNYLVRPDDLNVPTQIAIVGLQLERGVRERRLQLALHRLNATGPLGLALVHYRGSPSRRESTTAAGRGGARGVLTGP